MTRSHSQNGRILDEKILNRYFPKNTSSRSAFLVLFRDSLVGGLAKLASALEAGDAKEVIFLAHRLRGSVASIGAHHLSGIFQRIEEGGEVTIATSLKALIDEAVGAKGELFDRLGI